jgi:hypothetical protein
MDLPTSYLQSELAVPFGVTSPLSCSIPVPTLERLTFMANELDCSRSQLASAVIHYGLKCLENNYATCKIKEGCRQNPHLSRSEVEDILIDHGVIEPRFDFDTDDVLEGRV